MRAGENEHALVGTVIALVAGARQQLPRDACDMEQERGCGEGMRGRESNWGRSSQEIMARFANRDALIWWRAEGASVCKMGVGGGRASAWVRAHSQRRLSRLSDEDRSADLQRTKHASASQRERKATRSTHTW
eukprot:5213905-Pleurochrysis_carterae.AAC.2